MRRGALRGGRQLRVLLPGVARDEPLRCVEPTASVPPCVARSARARAFFSLRKAAGFRRNDARRGRRHRCPKRSRASADRPRLPPFLKKTRSPRRAHRPPAAGGGRRPARGDAPADVRAAAAELPRHRLRPSALSFFKKRYRTPPVGVLVEDGPSAGRPPFLLLFGRHAKRISYGNILVMATS